MEEWHVGIEYVYYYHRRHNIVVVIVIVTGHARRHATGINVITAGGSLLSRLWQQIPRHYIVYHATTASYRHDELVMEQCWR